MTKKNEKKQTKVQRAIQLVRQLQELTSRFEELADGLVGDAADFGNSGRRRELYECLDRLGKTLGSVAVWYCHTLRDDNLHEAIAPEIVAGYKETEAQA